MRFARAANSRISAKLQRASNRAQSSLFRSILSQSNSQAFKTQERAFGVPLVIEQEMGGERTYDIYSRLLKDRIICVFGQERVQNFSLLKKQLILFWIRKKVHDQLAAAVVAQLLFLASDKPDQPIKMYINSPGGVVTAGMAIYDCMQLIPCPVETWCLGNAASMGSLLLTAGSPGCRYALPNAQIMIHQPLGGAQGQATDILIAVSRLFCDFLCKKTVEISTI